MAQWIESHAEHIKKEQSEIRLSVNLQRTFHSIHMIGVLGKKVSKIDIFCRSLYKAPNKR